MALQTSGAISLSEVQSEFTGSNPISLSEYYRSGAYVPSGATAIPASGAIGISDFYGASNQFAFSITSTQTNANIRTLAIAAGWDQSTPVVANVNAGVTLHSNSTSTGGAVVSGSFPSGVTIVNSGNITGQGGSGGQAGGMALQITTSDTVKITNNSGAFIAGGGGGGSGSQGGGGAGQAAPGQAGAAGGSFTTSTTLSATVSPFGCSEGGVMTGTISCSAPSSGVRGAGGQQGASAGSGTTSTGSCTGTGTLFNVGNAAGTTPCSPISYSAGLSGGGGSPNPGGEGGSILSSTQNQTVSGGGWGLAGSGGGAGGSAISGTYASLTDNGTVYGSV